MNNSNRTPPRFGFARRVAVLFAVVALSLAVLGVVVTRRVSSMHGSIERLAEEQRETGSSMYLLHHMRMLDVHARKHLPQHWIASSTEVEELRFHCEQAQSTLEELRSGPDGPDPSAQDHVSHEERMYEGIEAGLDALHVMLSSDVDRDLPVRSITELVHMADVLNREVQTEEERASASLFRSATGLRSSVFWTSIIALLVLVVVLWLVHRSVVRPVLELRAGAARIASGDLQHRVSIRTGDEIGELAYEFNRMAGEVAQMRAELEQRVEERTREFLRAARMAGLGAMAAGIAHEINNPLASIATCAEGLGRRLRAGAVDPEEEREYLEIIAKEAYRAHGITSRLLEFAHQDGGPETDFAVTDLLRDIDVLLAHKLRERGVELAVECEPSLPYLRGRPGECKQVLLNLIHNAIDASPTGGRITVRCRRNDDRMILEVEDQGPGVSAENAERVFDPFFTTKAPGKGTGLGLAIVDRIVAAHKGRIDLVDTGHGALFRVTLPLPTESNA